MARARSKHDESWWRADDLRRLATDLIAAAGLPRDRAGAAAAYLLWFDAAAAHEHGIATLPDWLDRWDRGEFRPRVEGAIGTERGAIAVLDGQGGFPPWILARAGKIAAEKARDVGVGLVVVKNAGPTGPATPIAADLAIGPYVGAALGPGGQWTLAEPTGGGLPRIRDSRIGGDAGSPPFAWPLLDSEHDWLIAAVAVQALGPSAAFWAQRMEGAGDPAKPGPLDADRWEMSRQAFLDRGVPLPAEVAQRLKARADAAGIAFGA